MNLRELMYVVEVAETRNFSRAAKKLFISQPALSQYITKIEKRLGVALFDRSTIPLSITYAGEQFIEKAQNILSLANQLEEDMVNISKHKKSRLVIGAPPFRAKAFLPRVIPKFKERYPEVEIVIKEDSPDNLEMLLLKDEIDCVTQILPIMNKGIAYDGLAEEKIILAMPPKYKLQRLQNNSGFFPEISLYDLKDERFFSGSTKIFRSRIAENEIFKSLDIVPNITEINSTASALTLVSCGYGITFHTDVLATSYNSETKLSYFSLKEQIPATSVSFVFEFKDTRYLSKTIQDFGAVAKEICKQQGKND